MAIRGAVEAAVMDNLRQQDFCYTQARMGSWAGAPAWNRAEDILAQMPHQTPNGKTHHSQFSVGVPLRKFPESAEHRNLAPGSVLGEALHGLRKAGSLP